MIQLKRTLFFFVFSAACLLGVGPTAHADTTTGLVGWWTFDGKDTNWNTNTTNDLSGNGNNATMVNLSTSTSPVIGKIGQGLKMHNTSGYVFISSTPPILDVAANMTISMWFNSDTDDSITQTFISAGSLNNNIGFQIQTGACTTVFNICIQRNVVGGNEKAYTADNAFRPKVWNHLVVTIQNSTIAIYVNGVSLGISNAWTGSINSYAGTPLYIGRRQDADIQNFNGKLDDVRIYNRILSTTDIQQLYKQGAAKLGVSSTNSLTNGLVGYWAFNGKDTNWNSRTVNDLSGKGYTATIDSALKPAVTAISGAVGQAFGFFNSQQGAVHVPSNSDIDLTTTKSMSLSYWYNTFGQDPGAVGVGGSRMIAKGNFSNIGYSCFYESSLFTIQCQERNGGSFNAATAQVNSVQNFDKKWHHVVWIIDRTNNQNTVYLDGVPGTVQTLGSSVNPSSVDDLTIGYDPVGSSGFFNGGLDEVRIYNRALTASEALQLYKLGTAKVAVSPVNALAKGLVSYWTFDGKSINWGNSTVADASGNGNTGTMTGMSKMTSPVIGKIGQSLKFDGSTSQISANSTASFIQSGNVSYSVWVKVASNFSAGSGQQTVIANMGATSNNDVILQFENGSGSVCMEHADNSDVFHNACSSQTSWKAGVWYHLVGTFSTTAGSTIYVNGLSSGTDPDTNRGLSLASTFALGYGFGFTGTGYFGGTLDDVRVYNRTLSASEVTQLYKLGSSKPR